MYNSPTNQAIFNYCTEVGGLPVHDQTLVEPLGHSYASIHLPPFSRLESATHLSCLLSSPEHHTIVSGISNMEIGMTS